jgi:aminotransferase
MLCAPIIAQEAAIEALKNGKNEMLAMRDEYKMRRNVITTRLNEMGLTCFKPEGAFYVFPNISVSGMASNEFAMQLLEDYKIAVVPGTAFGDCGEGFVRCAYAASIDDINLAMDGIQDFLSKL